MAEQEFTSEILPLLSLYGYKILCLQSSERRKKIQGFIDATEVKKSLHKMEQAIISY